MPSTIILVHGAFAESASWDPVLDTLLTAGRGHDVIAAPNPLRGVAADAQAVSDVVVPAALGRRMGASPPTGKGRAAGPATQTTAPAA